MRRSRTASWAEVQCPPFFVQAPSSWRTCRGLGRPLAATAVVGSPGDDRPREAETARQRPSEVSKRLLVLDFSHPCRGLPGRGCHCVAPRESVVVALGRSTVGIVAHGVPEGLDLDGDDALADKQDAMH